MAASWLVANTRTFSRNLCQITAKSVHQPPSKLLVCKKSIPGRSIQGLHTRSLSCLSTRSVLRSSALRGDKRVGARTFRLTSAKCENVQTVSTPQFADSVSEGDINFLKAVGDAVAEDETVAEIETDKTALEVKAPAAGVIKELLVEDGSTVTQGMQLFKIAVGESGGAAPAAKPAEKPAEKPAAPAPPKEAPPPPPPPPAAKPIPSAPPPVPQKPTAPVQSKPAASVKVSPPAGDLPPAGARTETRVKMNRMRLRIAQRLKDAQNTCAMLTTFNEVDMSNIMELRTTYKDEFLKKHGIKFGFMSAFLKAAASGLIEMPEVNAVIDDAEIVYRDYVDISVAVATPKGLVVPVLRNAETMSYADIELALNQLGQKARDGKLAVEDMDGGTFTVSNGGVFGSMFGTPIINPPQSAILGMHGIFDRPVAVKGQVVVRPMMYVALTYDHRLIDGREAVLFLKRIKAAVEDPRVLLLNL